MHKVPTSLEVYVLALPGEIRSFKLSRQRNSNVCMNETSNSDKHSGSYCLPKIVKRVVSKSHHFYSTCSKCPPSAPLKFV